MKKRLLITLGCSFTEGVGCYDFDINPNRKDYCELNKTDYKKTVHNFHKYGWPNLVGRELNFDKVINLGFAGSSNSMQLKLYVDKVLPRLNELQKEFDIFLIWMMTEPTRFSFYTQHGIDRFSPSEASEYGIESNSLEKAYLDYMKEFKIGPIREQIFMIKVSESLFRDNNVTPLYTSWSTSFPELGRFYKNDYFLPTNLHYTVEKIYSDDNLKSEVEGCGHPNARGYKVIANKIINDVREFFPNFISNEKVTNFEWEWDGRIDYVQTIPKSFKNLM